MNVPQKLQHELKSLSIAFLYFGVWIGGLVVLKKLILKEYQIEFQGLSVAFMGVLVLSKVVLLFEPVPWGNGLSRDRCGDGFFFERSCIRQAF